MKIIHVVLTRYSDTFSRLFSIISLSGYTHASLSLDKDGERMYSFNLKGFCEETLARHRRHGVTHSVCYRLAVTDEAYEKLKARVDFFLRHKERYRYTKLGVALCLFGLPVRLRGRYFCSQFVAETLASAGAVPLRRSPLLYMPKHFCRDLAVCPQLRAVICNPV